MWLKRYMQFNFCEIKAALKVLHNEGHEVIITMHRFGSVKAHLSDLTTVISHMRFFVQLRIQYV